MQKALVFSSMLAAAAACSGGGGGGARTDAGSGGFDYDGTAGQAVRANFDSDLLPDISTTIGTNAPQLFTVDTGAPVVFMDSNLYTDHTPGVHANDTVKSFGLTFTNVQTVAFPIANDSPPGLLGGDLLRHFAYSLDYVGDRAWLSDPYSKNDIPAGVNVGVEEDIGFALLGGATGTAFTGCTGSCTLTWPATRILVQATIEDAAAPVWVLVDSGSSLFVMDPAVFAALDQDPNRPKIEGATLGTVTGDNDSFYTRVYRVQIAGPTGGATLSADNIVSAVSTDTSLLASLAQETGKPVKGLIGGAFFRNFLTTVDYQESKLRLSRYVDAQIDPQEWVSPGFLIDLTDNTATNVFTNQSAGLLGLQNGDTILAIGDLTLAGQSANTIVSAYLSYGEGDTMPVTFTHQGTMHTVNVMVQNMLPDYPPPS